MFIIKDNTYNADNIAWYGNKFLIGNGYFGIRGTLEEYTKEHLPAINLAGIYDRVGDKWRESVNAPNGLYTYIEVDGEVLRLPEKEPYSHIQMVDFKNAIHKRETSWKTEKGTVTLTAERFADMADCHLIGLKLSVKADFDGKLTIHTGIDADVWDINGPHFVKLDCFTDNKKLYVKGITGEKGTVVTVTEKTECDFGYDNVIAADKSIMHEISADMKAGKEYMLKKVVKIITSHDEKPYTQADKSYDDAYNEHILAWNKIWKMSEVEIDGDDDAMTALNYSIYHLNCIAPRHSESLSIPARGLSGQVYKGAVFWDTEMFMLDYFLYTDPNVARSLVKYRIDTLPGAKEKAAEYGLKGAFYAWESHEGGIDACSDYNIVDVFTKRPMRTFFRDKQVHVSAAVVYALIKYLNATSDYDILNDGGEETVIECAKFYESLLLKRADGTMYEIHDVVGPDEYHERVNNNAYTNRMAKFVFESACRILELQNKTDCDLYAKFNDYKVNMYIPKPNPNSGLIEQFDGYFKLEDVDIPTLKTRLLDDKEYWGGAYGIASQTQVIKQADVVAMMSMFKNDYSKEEMLKNWSYYEPRTEHGSSLSACMYSLLACYIGVPEKAYPLFMKSACADLNTPGKLWAGLVYIGGTHPAAAGGAWKVAVEGFAGIDFKDDRININPILPNNWKRLKFKINYRGKAYCIDITHEQSSVSEL